MKQRKIAVIAGTSDATDWIRSLPETDSVTAFVATPFPALAKTGNLLRTLQRCETRLLHSAW